MAKSRSRVADYAVYLLVRALVFIIQALSWQSALALARALAWLLYRVNRRHRAVAADNLRHAFPDRDEAAVDRLVRATYLHLTTMLVEMIRLPRVIHPGNVYDRVQHADPGDLDLLRAWAAIRRPKLVLTGHFGNWEILAYVAGMAGFRGSLVALNAATGAQIWKTYTIAQDARPTQKNKAGTQMWGPSGAPIWSAPAIDHARNAVYVTTGDNYSNPP